MKQIIKKGNKFGRLTAVKFSYRDNSGRQHWLFKCDCGNEKIARADSVKSGDTKSCGCLLKEHRKLLNFRHGMIKTKTYKSWDAMKQRCLNKNNKHFKDYGRRGITVCPEWLKFENFYADMGDRPENKTLDRIDNNRNYELSNCRWATPKEQSNNKRNNILITYRNKTQTIAQWSRELNITSNTLFGRIRRGWSVNKIFNL